MRNTRFIQAGALAALALAAIQTPTLGQTTFEVQVSPAVAGTFFLGHSHGRFAIMRQGATPLIIEEGMFRDEFGPGVNAGLRIAERFGVEAMFFWVPTRLEAEAGLGSYGDEVKVNSLMWGATALYYFPRLGDIEPFAGVGIGAETVSYQPELSWERRTDLMGNVVLGYHVWLMERAALRFEARDCITRFNSNITGIGQSTEHDLMISAGITLRSPLGK